MEAENAAMERMPLYAGAYAHCGATDPYTLVVMIGIRVCEQCYSFSLEVDL